MSHSDSWLQISSSVQLALLHRYRGTEGLLKVQLNTSNSVQAGEEENKGDFPSASFSSCRSKCSNRSPLPHAGPGPTVIFPYPTVIFPYPMVAPWMLGAGVSQGPRALGSKVNISIKVSLVFAHTIYVHIHYTWGCGQ